MFSDRHEAGNILAGELHAYAEQDAVVLALPRGGVPVGAAVARALNAPLDLLIARKIPHPLFSEYAIGAVTETGPVIWDDADRQQADTTWAEMAEADARREAMRRRQAYVGNREPIDVAGKVAIIVDDGAATGLTMRAAIAELKERRPSLIVVGLPVVPLEVAKLLSRHANDVIVVEAPAYGFGAVGQYYRQFDQLTDAEVQRMMREAAYAHGS